MFTHMGLVHTLGYIHTQDLVHTNGNTDTMILIHHTKGHIYKVVHICTIGHVYKISLNRLIPLALFRESYKYTGFSCDV